MEFTTTAMSRPDIINKTYHSFSKNLKGIDFKKSTLYINIDPLPKGNNTLRVVEVAYKYFGNVVYNTPEKPNFTNAVNWCWMNAKEDIIFHLEDDWIMTELVDVLPLIDKLNNSKLFSIPFRKTMNFPYDKPSLSPSFLHNRFYKAVAGRLDSKLNPEIQLRGKNFGIDMGPRQGIVDGYSDHAIIQDIGREWIDKTKYKKPKTKSEFVSWI